MDPHQSEKQDPDPLHSDGDPFKNESTRELKDKNHSYLKIKKKQCSNY